MKAQTIITAALICAMAVVCGCKGGKAAQDVAQEDKQTNTMKRIEVAKVSFDTAMPTIDQVEEMFERENVEFHAIDVVNWEAYPYKPEVKFRIVHSDDEIYLQYVVKEDNPRAMFDVDEGSQPYTDSCVEFFMIPSDRDTIYYNLEMNCVGHGTFHGGAERRDRTVFGDDVLSQVRRRSTLGDKAFGQAEGPQEWTLTLAIPKSIYALSEFAPFEGRTVKANFYKCGDKTPVPHFLSWNPIPIEKPNFHRPDHFGEIHFAE